MLAVTTDMTCCVPDDAAVMRTVVVTLVADLGWLIVLVGLSAQHVQQCRLLSVLLGAVMATVGASSSGWSS